MTYVIRLLGRADGTPLPGQGDFYLERFDARAAGGQGYAYWTMFLPAAMRFESKEDAFSFWRTHTPAGRPLTAYTVSIEEL